MATNTGVKDAIIALKDSGLMYKDIAAKVGCSKSVVSYHLGPNVKAAARRRQRRNRATLSDWVKQYKESQGCKDCGVNYPYYVLQFDHIGEKVENISRLARGTGGKARLLAEIEKCEVVCANCHAMRGHKRGYATNNGADTKTA